jgi:hypothetical protein
MGNCCSLNPKEKENDQPINEIIYSLKITKLTLGEFSDKINDYIKLNSGTSKNDFKSFLAEIFYEANPSRNKYSNIHEKIYEYFFQYIKDDINKFKFILFLFPLFKKIEGDAHKYYFGILFQIYSNKFSFNFLYRHFFTIFELFSYKISKIIFMNTQDEELKKNCYFMIKECFSFEKIDKCVGYLLAYIENFDKDNNNIDIEDLIKFFLKKQVFHFEDIKNYIINSKLK